MNNKDYKCDTNKNYFSLSKITGRKIVDIGGQLEIDSMGNAHFEYLVGIHEDGTITELEGDTAWTEVVDLSEKSKEIIKKLNKQLT